MAKAYLYDLTDTWNAGATTFTAIKMNVTDTASASGSLLMDLQVGESSKFSVRKDGAIVAATKMTLGGMTLGENGSGQITVRSNGIYGWSNDTTGTTAYDLILTRDAANTLAQRNGTSAQAFRVYNTYTDASNYERAALVWSANTFTITSEAVAGTGVTRTLQLRGAEVAFISSGTGRWRFNTLGNFITDADNTYDIGASNANRPRNVHVAGYVSIGDGITAPGAGTGAARIYVDSADGDLKIVFADGTVKTIVTDT